MRYITWFLLCSLPVSVWAMGVVFTDGSGMDHGAAIGDPDLAPSDTFYRITSDGDYRVTESGDRRIYETD